MPTTPTYIKGNLGNGAVLSIGSLTGQTTENFIVVGGIMTFSADGLKRGTVDRTNLQSGGVVRKLDTTLDYQTMSFTVSRDSADAGQAVIMNAITSGGCWDFKVLFPVDKEAGQTATGDTVAFSAIVTEAGGFNLDVDKADESKITLTLDGAWVITEGA